MTAHLWPTQPPEPPPGDDGGLSWRDIPGSGIVEDGLNWAGDQASQVAQNAFSDAMQAVWDSAIWLLKGGFEIADTVSRVEPGTITGNDADNPAPIGGAAVPAAPPGGAENAMDLGSLWSTMIWLAALIALGLFFYQLASVALRGGRGMFRAVTGPVQFGIALAVTTGAVAALLTGADGLTAMFLSNLGEQGSFTAIMDNPAVADRFGDNPDLGADVEDGVRSMILGIAALFGVIPAAIGFALAMIFRAAAIMVLIATIPIAAACLVSDTTASMFWRAVRWILAAVLMKPALALVVVIGVNIMSRTQGVAGLLAGTAVLLISLFCPMVLYRLLAFVDPGTGAGMAVRSGGGFRSAGEPGADNGTSEMINTARAGQKASDVGGSSSGGAAGGELGGSTAAAGRASGGAGAGAGGSAAGGAAVGGAGGGGAASGAAAGAGIAGGAVAAAVVGGYLATKAAGQAAGGYGSSQMAQTGVGHPGPAPAAGAGGGQISSAASDAYSATSTRLGHSSGGDRGPTESGDSIGGDGGGGGLEPPPVDPGPPDSGPPDGGGPTAGPGGPQDPPEPSSVNAGTDRASTPDFTGGAPAPGSAPEPRHPTRPDRDRKDNR